jgi:dockerin type I repeat protein
VLDIINYLNAVGPGVLKAEGESSPSAASFYDVNADGLVTPRDALDIINHLNAFGIGGEGEAALPDAVPSGSADALADVIAFWRSTSKSRGD